MWCEGCGRLRPEGLRFCGACGHPLVTREFLALPGGEGAAESLAAERASTLARLTGLEREVAAIIEAAGQGGTDDEHDPEGATIAFERQHLAALVSQARGQLVQIDAALRRLAEGSYGRCDRCGQPIAAARLAARPAATLCITCASRR